MHIYRNVILKRGRHKSRRRAAVDKAISSENDATFGVQPISDEIPSRKR